MSKYTQHIEQYILLSPKFVLLLHANIIKISDIQSENGNYFAIKY